MTNSRYTFKQVKTSEETNEFEKAYKILSGINNNVYIGEFFYIKVSGKIKAVASVTTFEEKSIVFIDFIYSEVGSKCDVSIMIELFKHFKKLGYCILMVGTKNKILSKFYKQFDPVLIDNLHDDVNVFTYKINEIDNKYLMHTIFKDMNVVTLSSCCDKNGFKNLESFRIIPYYNEYQYIGDILCKIKTIDYNNNFNVVYPTNDKLYKIITLINQLKSAKISSFLK